MAVVAPGNSLLTTDKRKRDLHWLNFKTCVVVELRLETWSADLVGRPSHIQPERQASSTEPTRRPLRCAAISPACILQAPDLRNRWKQQLSGYLLLKRTKTISETPSKNKALVTGEAKRHSPFNVVRQTDAERIREQSLLAL